MKKKIRIAPSILSADFSVLSKEVKRAEEAGADMIHVDVMDGHFVPNMTIGPVVVRDIRKVTKLPLDVHLMIEKPSKYVDEFIKAGSDILTIHAESEKDIGLVVSHIRSSGIKAGVSLKPKSGLDLIEKHLKNIDMVLIMTVEPGFSGQKFMSDMMSKVRSLRKVYNGDIEVDGGINKDNAKEAIKAGANILVAGTYVFKSDNIEEAIKSLRG